MAKRTYYVVEPLCHDGEDVPVGGKVELEEGSKSAKDLLAAKVITTQKPVAANEAKGS